MSTVSDGGGVGVGCADGVAFGAELEGCGDLLLFPESGTAGGGGAGDGACVLAAESGAALAAESPGLGFEPEHADPNAMATTSAGKSRCALTGASRPTRA